MQQCRFPAAVAAEHRPQFTAINRQLQIAAQDARPDGDGKVLTTERHALRDNRSNRTGTPINAVNTPTGNCCGAHMVRANVSASVTKLPPTSADAGNSQR